jgi:hypothetical protein
MGIPFHFSGDTDHPDKHGFLPVFIRDSRVQTESKKMKDQDSAKYISLPQREKSCPHLYAY